MKKILIIITALLMCTACGLKNEDLKEKNTSDSHAENIENKDTAETQREVYSNDEALNFETYTMGLIDGSSKGELRTVLDKSISEGTKLSCANIKVLDTKYYIMDVEDKDFFKKYGSFYKQFLSGEVDYDDPELMEKINEMNKSAEGKDFSGFNKGARIYSIEILEVDEKYNKLGLKKGDKIEIAYPVNPERTSWLALKNPQDYENVINESKETVKLGDNTYYRLWLDKKYEYMRLVESEGKIFLRDGVEYAIEIYKPDSFKGQDYYSWTECYPINNLEQTIADNKTVCAGEFWKDAHEILDVMKEDLKTE